MLDIVQPAPRIKFAKCPLCQSSDFNLIHTANCSGHRLYVPEIPSKIEWMCCRPCGHVFTDGYFSEIQNAALFKNAHAHQIPGSNIEDGRFIAARIVDRISSRTQGKRWLDVGFGDGSLLLTAREFGFDVVGTDLRQAAEEALSELGIQTHKAALEELPKEWQFDIISMADVLEHTPFPKATLTAAHARLASGGLLFVSCPNSEAAPWDVLTAQSANPYWWEIEHFHNFSRTRLYALLKETGFEPIHYAVSERYRMGMEIVARRMS